MKLYCIIISSVSLLYLSSIFSLCETENVKYMRFVLYYIRNFYLFQIFFKECLHQKRLHRQKISRVGKNSQFGWVQWIAYEVHTIHFQTFFVWALLSIVHTWNSSPLRSNLLRLQCTCTVPTRPHRSPLVWAFQWPSSRPLSSLQLSHNDSLWA